MDKQAVHPKTFNTFISNSFIGTQTLTTTSSTDELIINRTSGTTGIFKTTVGPIVNTYATSVGSIMIYAGATAPTDWLMCDGAEISRATYNKLFAVIGTQFGTPKYNSGI